MSTLIVVLRTLSLLAFAAPALLVVGRRRGETGMRARQIESRRAPVAANIAAFGLYFLSLLTFSGSSAAPAAVAGALAGCLLALAGAALVARSRVALGPAWSLVPRADQGLVTTGPYGIVRHPIYLGLTLVAAGAALAFASPLAFLVVVSGIVPTFAWRASAEEKLLSRTFGEGYEAYRRRTKLIIPHLL